MEDIKQRIEALKEEKEDGRTRKTDTSSADTLSISGTDVKSAGSTDKEAGTAKQSVRNRSTVIGRSDSQAGDNGQRAQNIIERKREGTGGYSNDNTGPAKDSAPTRTGGGAIVVERLDDVPYRDFDYEPPEEEPIEPTKKEKNNQYFKDSFKKAKGFFREKKHHTPLSEEEAKHYEETLPELLIDYGEYTDKAIAWYSKQAEDEMGPIWGDLSQDEANTVTRILIKRGKRNGHTANFIRNLEEGYDYIALGIIVVPRAMRTSEEIKKSPRRSVRLHDHRNRGKTVSGD